MKRTRALAGVFVFALLLTRSRARTLPARVR